MNSFHRFLDETNPNIMEAGVSGILAWSSQLTIPLGKKVNHWNYAGLIRGLLFKGLI